MEPPRQLYMVLDKSLFITKNYNFIYNLEDMEAFIVKLNKRISLHINLFQYNNTPCLSQKKQIQISCSFIDRLVDYFEKQLKHSVNSPVKKLINECCLKFRKNIPVSNPRETKKVNSDVSLKKEHARHETNIKIINAT